MRWIRWSYVLPRLLLVIVVLLAIEMSAGLIVRRSLVAIGQRAVGARVEIGSSRASVLHTKAALEGIEIADPRSPMKNLLQADRLALDFETDALLRKKAIASRGTLRGLRFGEPRSRSGQLPGETTPAGDLPRIDWLSDGSVDAAETWLQDVALAFGQDLADELESVHLARELGARWPQKYTALEDRSEELRERAQQLEESIKLAQANPLRHVKVLEGLTREIKALDRALGELYAEIDALPAEVAADRQRILEARRHDENLVREKLCVDDIDTAKLSAYFVQEQLQEPVATLVAWIRWSRQVFSNRPEPQRRRGTDVLFAGCRQQPDLLVRELHVQGTARIGGQPVELFGTIADATNQPKVHGRPMTFEFTTSGSLPLHLQASIDRTGELPHDELQIDCQHVLLPEFDLGDAEVLGMTMAPSTGSLAVRLSLAGDELSGTVQLKQESVSLSPVPGPRLGKSQLSLILADSLQKLDSLDTRVVFEGTLGEPRCKISSNMGSAVSTALVSALRKAAEAKSREFVGDSRGYVDDQLATLDRLVDERTAKLLGEVTGPSEQIEKLAESISGGSLSLEQLGRRLPKNSLFR